ncbi:MAG: DUF1826 domain-containing protein [Bacteroidota bacterium]
MYVVHIATRLLKAYFIALPILFGCYIIQYPYDCINDGDHKEDVKFTSNGARNVSLFYWKRSINPVITIHLEQYMTKELRPVSFFSSASNLSIKLNESRALWNTNYTDVADSLWTDIYRLAYDFLSFSQSKSAIVHPSTIGDNANTKFHIHKDKLRLFTAYDEKGTEWVPERGVNCLALSISNGKTIKNPSQI